MMSTAYDKPSMGSDTVGRTIERIIYWAGRIKSLARPLTNDSKLYSKYYDEQFQVFCGVGDPDEDYVCADLEEGWLAFEMAAKAIGVDKAELGARTKTFNEQLNKNAQTTALRCLTGAVCHYLPKAQKWYGQHIGYAVSDDFDSDAAGPAESRKPRSLLAEGESLPPPGYTVDRTPSRPKKKSAKRRRVVADDSSDESSMEEPEYSPPARGKGTSRRL